MALKQENIDPRQLFDFLSHVLRAHKRGKLALPVAQDMLAHVVMAAAYDNAQEIEAYMKMTLGAVDANRT